MPTSALETCFHTGIGWNADGNIFLKNPPPEDRALAVPRLPAPLVALLDLDHDLSDVVPGPVRQLPVVPALLKAGQLALSDDYLFRLLSPFVFT